MTTKAPAAAERRRREGPTISSLVPLFGTNRMNAAIAAREVGLRGWIGVPFAGGLSEVPHFSARTIAVNDLHGAIINLAMVAADDDLGPKLYRRLRRLPLHPLALLVAQERCRLREQMIDQGHRPMAAGPDLAWAEDYFVASWMGRSARAGTDDEFSGGIATRWEAGGGDSAVRFANAARSLVAWRRTLRRCTFTVMDAMAFIDQTRDDDDSALYVDPPFPGPGDAYKVKFGVDRHRFLAQRLCAFQRARVVCRFYDHPLIRELYPPEVGWTWRHLPGRKASNAAAPEVLILNGESYDHDERKEVLGDDD